MKIPYGLADFYRLVTEGYLYVDRTAFIRRMEELGNALLFVRPRRFGKSLWLRTLSCYYDLRLRDEHERLFGRLAIGRDPTALAHRYFVMEWNLSAVDPRGTADEIATRLNGYVNRRIRTFLSDYREHLPEKVRLEDDAVYNLDGLLAVLRRTPYRLYLLVDEYDNFANEVMMSDQATYSGLVHADGPYKRLMKWVKLAMEGQGLDRLFLTGISPIVMSDLTSGLNICRNVYLLPQLHELCGFREDEIRELLAKTLAEIGGSGLALDDALAMMRIWYDGYRFAPTVEEKIYNPTLTLYFLLHLLEQRRYPEQMLDANLAADEDKLEYIARAVPGQQVMMNVLQTDQPIEIGKLEERFTLADMLKRGEQDETFLASFLYYFGMLTLEGTTARRTLLLRPPNQVTKTLYVDQMLSFLLPEGPDRSAAKGPAWELMAGGDVEPLLEFVEDKLFPVFANRDYQWMNELAVKAVFLTLLFNDVSYMTFSEPELERGYADLCLLLRPDARATELWDLLLEFKFLRPKELGLGGKDLRELTREELIGLEPVRSALTEAEEQLTRYRDALNQRFGSLRLRCHAVVSLGFERLVGRGLSG